MKQQDQVCTKMQSMRLKDFGIIQNAIFFHHVSLKNAVIGNAQVVKWGTERMVICVEDDTEGSFAAFTVSELNIMLGAVSNGVEYDDENNVWITHWDDRFVASYRTEAQCAAALLIQQLGDNQITAEDCNKRLLK